MARTAVQETEPEAPTAPAVETYEEAVATDELIADLLAKRTEALAERDLEIKRLVDKRTEYARESLAEIMANFDALREYVFKHKKELLEDGKSSCALPGDALLKWYESGKAVVFKRGVKVDDVVQWLKSRKMRRYLRIKYELNKDRLLDEPEKAQEVEGVRIRESQELFAYTPRGRTEVLRYNIDTGKSKLELKSEEKMAPMEDEE